MWDGTAPVLPRPDETTAVCVHPVHTPVRREHSDLPLCTQNKAFRENKALFYLLQTVNECGAQILQGPERWSKIQVVFCPANFHGCGPTRKPAVLPCTEV